MSEDRQSRIEAVFHKASEINAAEQEAYVRATLHDDPEAMQEVLSLLALETGSSATMERVLESPQRMAASTVMAHPGRVGAYVIEEEISHGGMGRVFLGRRADDEYDSLVAIKLIRLDRHNEWAEARFRKERQMLANLSHPNIAMLLDGGTAEDGQPYVVMEYVNGKPIDEYVRDRNLSLDQRLTLFTRVCAAINHAHQNLVIHRDIKPANILVNEAGEPKLLDFGIAKLVSEDQPDHATMTQMGLMTLAYASPEQIQGSTVSTASDIYSLGVLLYELLTGQSPFRLRGNAPSELIRAVCETEPIRPSLSVSSPRFARKLRGDLDNILLKAIRKSPERRYASANEFSADIENFRHGLPVNARKTTAFYRVSKFVRRHAIGSGVAALFTLILAAVVTFYTIELTRERDRAVLAEETALAAAETARQEATTANRVSAFLTGLFEAVDPRAGIAGKDLTARELLDLGAESLETQLSDEPATRAHMWRTIGLAYAHMGDFDSGINALRQSLALHREHSGALEIGEALNRLAEILRRDDQFDESVSLHREAIALHEASHDQPTWELADAYNNFGLLLYNLGQYDEAEVSLGKAITTHRAASDGESASVGINMHNLSLIQRMRADFSGAEAMIRESLAITGRMRGTDTAPYVVSLQQLGRIQNDLGQYETALETLNDTLERSRPHYEEDNPRMGTVWNRLANTHQALGNHDQAEVYYQRALEVFNASHGPESWNMAYTTLEYAEMLWMVGRLDEAEPLIRKSLSVRMDKFQTGHPHIALARVTLAGLLVDQGKSAEAEQQLASAIPALQSTFSDDHPELAWARIQRSRTMDSAPDARERYQQGLAVLENRAEQYPARLNQARRYRLNTP